jgi:hypothetical protein
VYLDNDRRPHILRSERGGERPDNGKSDAVKLNLDNLHGVPFKNVLAVHREIRYLPVSFEERNQIPPERLSPTLDNRQIRFL